MSEFKLWSELNPSANQTLKPNLDLREWGNLNAEEKQLIWQHLEKYFSAGNLSQVSTSIQSLNQAYKAKSFGRHYLKIPSHESALKDFYHIFTNETTNVVMELLSLYFRAMFYAINGRSLARIPLESPSQYQERASNERRQSTDKVILDFDDVFTHFSLNVSVTRLGIIPKQDTKIAQHVVNPVLTILANPKWEKVNKLLSDSFEEYRKNTEQGYSVCVTHTIAAVEAFLQIIVNGETGEGNLSKLIPDAQKKKLIPDDFFTQEIFKSIESIFARERKETGVAHPKKAYATEKNARMIINLAMVFLQHCIQK